MDAKSMNKLWKQYGLKEESLSPLVRRFCFQQENCDGEMYLLEPYEGVQVRVSEFQSKSMEFPFQEDGNLLGFNYCMEGRYEIQMPESKYVYIEKGTLSVDTTPFIGLTSFPGGKYMGLEMIIDLDKIVEKPIMSWEEYEINPTKMAQLSKNIKGTFLVNAGYEWEQLAQEFMGHIKNADLSAGNYRFLLLRLLWSFQNEQEQKEFTVYKPIFLTAGQRNIAIRTEKKLTEDLGKHYIIADLAKQEGISATSLKKYFALHFGNPISFYLKEERIKRAEELLRETSMSIADIASHVGYENQGKFSTMFRQEKGSTPIEYRRLHRKEHIFYEQ